MCCTARDLLCCNARDVVRCNTRHLMCCNTIDLFSRERHAKGSRLVRLQPGPSCPSRWPAAVHPRNRKTKKKHQVFLGFSSLAQGPAGPGPGLAPEPALGPHDGQSDPKGRPKGARGHPFSKRLLQKRRHFSEKRPAGGKIAPEARTFTNKNVVFLKNDPPEAG